MAELKFKRTVKELKAFLANLPDDLIVRGYEGEDIGVAFDGQDGDGVAWFSSTDARRDEG